MSYAKLRRCSSLHISFPVSTYNTVPFGAGLEKKVPAWSVKQIFLSEVPRASYQMKNSLSLFTFLLKLASQLNKYLCNFYEKFVRIKFNSRLWQGRHHAISAYGPPKFDDLLSNEKHWGPREHDHSLVFGGRRLDSWYLLWPKRIITGKCFIFCSFFIHSFNN